MTTSRCRKVGKSPFPLLSTASLRVCQTPMRFLVPMCTWSKCAEVMLPATTWREQLAHDNLQGQGSWQVSFPTSMHSFVACVPDAHAILGSNVHMERVRWSDVTCNRLTEENNVFMTTCKYRKTGKFPFPPPSTASLRVCQTPMRFLVPMCTWSECAEVMLPATAWLKRTTCSWQPASAGKLASLLSHFYAQLRCVCARCPCDSWIQSAHGASSEVIPATAWREQLVHDNLQGQESWQVSCSDLEPRIPNLQVSNLESRISNLGSRISDFEFRISNLESRISNLESRISDLESRISNLESRTWNLESRISDLESRIWNLESRISSPLSQVRSQ